MPMLLAAAAIVGQVLPPPTVTLAGAAFSQVIVDLTPTAAICGGTPVTAVDLAKPIPTTMLLAPTRTVEPFVLEFRIDTDGRPLSIVQPPRPTTSAYLMPSDLQPALAASRFAPGAPRDRCTIRYVARLTPIVDASIETIYRLLALPHDRGPFEAAVQKRARDAAPGCFGDRPPAVLLRGYPDFDAVPQPQGALSMTMVGFDIDASGKPIRVRTVTSDGNDALDAAGRDAVARSRFGKGVRTGCTFPYYRRQTTPLAAPPPPAVAAFRTPGSACDEDGGRWALPPRMTFPEPFRRRGIEGWAVIRYDVAPWGETGNVTVVASEPAAMFGDQARRIIAAARRPVSATGATGCVDRVKFVLPDGNTEEASPPPPPPIID